MPARLFENLMAPMRRVSRSVSRSFRLGQLVSALARLVQLDGKIIPSTGSRIQEVCSTELRRQRPGGEAEIAVLAQMNMRTKQEGWFREDKSREDAQLLRAIVEATSRSQRRMVLTVTFQERATDVVRAEEAEGEKVVDVLARGENAAEALLEVVGETDQKGRRVVLEWSTGGQGKPKKSWTQRWRIIGVQLTTQKPLHQLPLRVLHLRHRQQWLMMILI